MGSMIVVKIFACEIVEILFKQLLRQIAAISEIICVK
jgi:hypothetical protein